MMMTLVQKTGDYSQPIVRKRPDEDKRQSEEEGAQAEGDFMSEAKVMMMMVIMMMIVMMIMMTLGLGWGADLWADGDRADPGDAGLHPLHLQPRHLLHRRLQVINMLLPDLHFTEPCEGKNPPIYDSDKLN